jgi:hypothetical protein
VFPGCGLGEQFFFMVAYSQSHSFSEPGMRPIRQRFFRRCFLPLALLVGWVSMGSPAQAESSSWLFVGTGLSALSWKQQSRVFRPNLQIDTGLGTSPSGFVMIGGGVRMMPHFGEGTDFAAYLRGASQGYVTGKFGLALDAGAYVHGYGPDTSSGFVGTLNLGGPWGVVLSTSVFQGTQNFQGYTATLGLDFLRLTVYRLGGEKQWPNVNPAWRPDAN